MSAIVCPHCGSTISVVGFSPGQLVACGHCGNTLQVPAAETPLAPPVAPQARPMPRGAPPPLPNAATTQPVQPGPMQPAPMQPVPYSPSPAPAESTSSPSAYVPPRRRRSSSLATMIVVVLATVVLVGGGLGSGGYFLSRTELPRDETAQRQPIVIKKPVGGRVRLESSGYKPKGPHLSITRSQFRDQVEALPYSYNSSTAQRWFHSGQSFVDAFGRPHRVRHLDDEVHYYWNCSDGTLKVVCPISQLALENRNSADGSALIVHRIDNEFY